MEEGMVYADSCYECVEKSINEAIQDSEFQYTSVDKERLEKLKSLCELIDQMNQEFEIVFYEATTSTEHSGIEITIGCSEIIVDRISHPFYEALKFCEIVEISHGEYEDGLNVRFIFPDLYRV